MPEDIQTLLREAEQAHSQREWDYAIDKLKATLEQDPGNEDACYRLAELLKVRGLISSVIEQYFTLMDILEQKEDYDSAVEVAQWIMKLQPENDKARMRTILIYKEKGNLEEVVKQSLHLARLYIELNQGDQSILLLKNAQEIAPDNLDIGLELAEMYISHGHIQEGTNQYRKIANAYLAKGKYEKAAEAFRRMKVVIPDDPQLLFTLGNLYMQLNRFDDAEAEFRAILRHNLNHTEALMALGSVCQKKGQFRDAILAFNKILSVSPQNEIAKEKLGELYQAQGATSEAVKHFLQAANTYQYGDDIERAIKLYQRVLTIDHNNPTATRELTNLGAPLEADESDMKDADIAKLTPLEVDDSELDLPGPSLEEMAGAIVPREASIPTPEESLDEFAEHTPRSIFKDRIAKGGAVPSAFGAQTENETITVKRNIGDDLVYSGDEAASSDLILEDDQDAAASHRRALKRKGGGERLGGGLIRKNEMTKKGATGKKGAAEKRSGLLTAHGKPLSKKGSLGTKDKQAAGILHRKKGEISDDEAFEENMQEKAAADFDEEQVTTKSKERSKKARAEQDFPEELEFSDQDFDEENFRAEMEEAKQDETDIPESMDMELMEPESMKPGTLEDEEISDFDFDKEFSDFNEDFQIPDSEELPQNDISTEEQQEFKPFDFKSKRGTGSDKESDPEPVEFSNDIEPLDIPEELQSFEEMGEFEQIEDPFNLPDDNLQDFDVQLPEIDALTPEETGIPELGEPEMPELPSFDNMAELPQDFDSMIQDGELDLDIPESRPTQNLPELGESEFQDNAEKDKEFINSVFAGGETPKDNDIDSDDSPAGTMLRRKKPLSKSKLGKNKSAAREDIEQKPETIETTVQTAVADAQKVMTDLEQVQEPMSIEPIEPLGTEFDEIPSFEEIDETPAIAELPEENLFNNGETDESFNLNDMPEMPDFENLEFDNGNAFNTSNADFPEAIEELGDLQLQDMNFGEYNENETEGFDDIPELPGIESEELFRIPEESEKDKQSDIEINTGMSEMTFGENEWDESNKVYDQTGMEIPEMPESFDISELPDFPEMNGQQEEFTFDGFDESSFDLPDLDSNIPDEQGNSIVLDDMTTQSSFTEQEIDTDGLSYDTGEPGDMSGFMDSLDDMTTTEDVSDAVETDRQQTESSSIFGADLGFGDDTGFGSFEDLLKLAEEIENIIPDEERIREAEERKREEEEKRLEEERQEREAEEARIAAELAAPPREDELPALEETDEEQGISTTILEADLPALGEDEDTTPDMTTVEMEVSFDAVEEVDEDVTIPVSTSVAAPTSFLSMAEIPIEEISLPTQFLEGVEMPQEVEFEDEDAVEVAEEVYEEPVPQPEPEPDIFEKIQAIVNEGDLGKAFPMYVEALESNPENHTLRKSYADICFEYGLTETALQSYDEILNTEPRNYEIRKKIIRGHLISDNMEEAVSSLVEYGNQLTGDDRVEEALRIYQHALALDKNNPKAREALFEIYLNQDMKQLALFHLNILADYLECQESVEESIKVLKKIYALTSDIETQEKLAKVYIQNGQNANAIIELQSLAERYAEKNEFKRSAGHYEKVVELDTKHIEAHNKLIELYTKLNEKEKSYHEKVIVADLLMEKNQLNEARIRYEDCLKNKNYDNEVRRKLINIYLKQNNFPQALEESKILSEVYHKERRYEEAIILYNQLISHQPRNLMLREKLSEFYILSDQFEKGMEQLIIVAEEYASQHDWDEAIKMYRKTLTVDDQRTEIHFRLGEIFLKHKANPLEARYEFERVYELDPEHKKSMEYLIKLYIDEDKPGKAMNVLKSLIEIDNSFNTMIQKIIDNYTSKIADNPNDFRAHFNLGIVYKEMELWKQAIEQFQITRKSNEMVLDSHCMLGICFSQQPPMINLAVKTFQKGLELKDFPEKDYLELHYHLGMLNEKLGKLHEAVEEYEAIIAVDAHYKNTSALLKSLKDKIG